MIENNCIVLILDFETRFDKEYTLNKLTMEEYIRDERFEALVLSVGSFNGETYYLAGPEDIKEWIEDQDWSRIAVVAHNAAFDVGILSMVYGVMPRLIICTMSLARAIFGPLKSVSLESLAKTFDLDSKTVPYNAFMGYRWGDMPQEIRDELIEGCKRDIAITRECAARLIKDFPKEEMIVIDLTIRMFTQPQFIGDVPLLKAIAEDEFYRKNDIICALNVTETQLQSAAKFVALLEECGETVPLKPGKIKCNPCIAATDSYMQELAGGTGRAAKLARARLDVRSTIEERRAYRLATIAERGPIPVYLAYCAANTNRWGGGEKTNLQNLPKEGKIRQGLMAPPGHRLAIIDFSQIEYRILCKLAREDDKLAALSDPARNLYCEFGHLLFGRLITREDTDEYALSKKITLASGYGTGQEKAFQTARNEGFDFDREITDKAIDLFRKTHKGVVALWRRLDRALIYMEQCAEVSNGIVHDIPVLFDRNVIRLPNGLSSTFDLKYEDGMLYRKTRRSLKDPKSLFDQGYSTYWGGGLTEWLCQSLARIKLSDFILQVYEELGIRPCLLVHDEFVCVVEEDQAEKIMESLLEYAAVKPDWWQNGPPFKAEGRITERYGG